MNSVAKSPVAGRVLMTVATLCYGVLPLLVDLTETHVFHPGWTPHARMHMVWLLGTNSAIAVLALYCLWLYRTNAHSACSLPEYWGYASSADSGSAPLQSISTEAP